MTERIRVGILGLGSIGITHARVLAGLASEVELVAFSGGSTAAAAEAGWSRAEQREVEALLTSPDVDVVTICSPSEVHGEHTLRALAAGKHVVVEKPMSTSVAEAVEIVGVAEQTGLLVSPIAQRRFEPVHQELRTRLMSGELGTPVLGETFVHWYRDDDYYAAAEWRRSQIAGGGSLMNQGLHNVDLLQWLLGPVLEVTGQSATRGRSMEAEDTTVATCRFTGGALGVIVTSTATPPGSPAALSLRTTRGHVTVDQEGLVEWEFPGLDAPQVERGPDSGASDPAAIGIRGHLAQWQDVLVTLRTGVSSTVTARDGFDTVALIQAIYRAAESGRLTPVDATTAGPLESTHAEEGR